jgi:hypothetical protein
MRHVLVAVLGYQQVVVIRVLLAGSGGGPATLTGRDHWLHVADVLHLDVTILWDQQRR